MDLSKLSDADLLALKSGDLSKVSTDGLMALRGNAAPAAPAPKKETSFVSGVVQGFRDPLDAAAQLLERGASAIGVPTDKINAAVGMPSSDEARKNAAAGIESALGAPGTGGRIVGNLLATAPLAAALPASAATLPGRIAQGAGTGAAFGTLQPVESGDFWDEKGKQVGMGAVTGGIAAPVVSGAARLVMPKAATRAKTLLDEGVTPTPGQLLGGAWKTTEDKLTSVPILGDAINSSRRKAVDELNRAVYARALNPIGGKVPDAVGREGVAAVKDQLGAAYDNLLPQMRFVSDPAFKAEIGTITQMVNTLPKREARQFADIMARELNGRMTPGGVISGETLKTIQSQLGSEARAFGGSTDAYQRKLGEALREAGDAFRRGIERSNPQYADDLARINGGYANYATLRNAASRAGSREGVVTPAQLSAAVRSQDKSAGKGAFAAGRARMQDLADEAVNVLGTQVPDSGTAGRLLLGGAIGGAGALWAPDQIPYAAMATLPFLPGGRQAAAALLARRPAGAEQVAEGIRRLAVPSAVAAPALGQQLLE